jgi:hypothetical protein
LRASPFDASAWLLHATFSGPAWALDGAPAPPWPGASRGAGWREFSRAEALACAARVGGVGFVGDSVMRETFNALLRLAGDCTCIQEACCVDSRVPHAEQAHEAAFDAGGGATARLSFRFARNAGAELGERVAGLLDGGAAAIVAGSGFWDLNPGQGGAAAQGTLAGWVVPAFRAAEARATPESVRFYSLTGDGEDLGNAAFWYVPAASNDGNVRGLLGISFRVGVAMGAGRPAKKAPMRRGGAKRAIGGAGIARSSLPSCIWASRQT